MSFSSLCPSHSREARPWQLTMCGYLRGSHTRFGGTNWYRPGWRPIGKEERQGTTGVWGAGVSPPWQHSRSSLRRHNQTAVTLLLSLRHRAHLSNASAWIGAPRPTRTCLTIQAKCMGNARRLRGFRAVLRRRHPTTVAHPRRRLGACHSASSYLWRLTQNDSVAGLQAVDSPSRLQVDQIYFH